MLGDIINKQMRKQRKKEQKNSEKKYLDRKQIDFAAQVLT